MNGIRVEFRAGGLFEAPPDRTKGRIDLLGTNPPHVSAGEYEKLPDEIRRHERLVALVAGPWGDQVFPVVVARGGFVRRGRREFGR